MKDFDWERYDAIAAKWKAISDRRSGDPKYDKPRDTGSRNPDNLTKNFFQSYEPYLNDVEIFYEGNTMLMLKSPEHSENLLRYPVKKISDQYAGFGMSPDLVYVNVIQDLLLVYTGKYLPTLKNDVSRTTSGVEKVDLAKLEHMLKGSLRGVVRMFNEVNDRKELNDEAEEISRKLIGKLSYGMSLSDVALPKEIDRISKMEASDDEKFKLFVEYKKKFFS